MTKLKIIIPVLVCCGLQTATIFAKIETAKADEPIVYKVSNGTIEIKPRMKYELLISTHVLRAAEDHHKLFVPWAKKMRKSLTKKTLREAMILGGYTWQLCSLLQEYDGPDTIDGIVDFVRKDNDKAIMKWASYTYNQRFINALGLGPDQFPTWYADFLKRYYEEGFGEQWSSEHKQLVYEDAKSVVKELESLDFSSTYFMGKITGRKFSGSTKIILYPSSFSRPQHAYGFSEGGNKVTVYKIGSGKAGVLGSIFHELLHPLIRGWQQSERMKEPIAKLAGEPLFKASWEQNGKGSYDYPNGWIDELMVHAISNYIQYKAGFLKERKVRDYAYSNYEKALCDAIFDKYDSFDNIDDFIFYAINHIKVVGKGKKAHFKYIEENEE